MIKKSKGVQILMDLVSKGVEFFCFSGPVGSGKDLQADLVEASMLNYYPIAHVGTSMAIRHHMKDESDLGRDLRLASENERKGILFPDEPTLEAVAADVSELYSRKWFKKFILTGFPRGKTQPKIAWLINGEVLFFKVSLSTAMKRAIERVRLNKLRGLPLRKDNDLITVRKRWKDEQKETLPAFAKVAKRHNFRPKIIDADQPIRSVFGDVLKAIGAEPLQIDNCLALFDGRKGEIGRILEGIEEPVVIPRHWPVSKKVEAVKRQIITNNLTRKEAPATLTLGGIAYREWKPSEGPMPGHAATSV